MTSVAVTRVPKVRIDHIDAAAYEIPTEQPESDGTLEWNSTTLVVVHANAADQIGMGYTYADASAATLARGALAASIVGVELSSPSAALDRMIQASRNNGYCGVVAMAASAIDVAMWDLWGRLLDIPTRVLLGNERASVPVYGSGGFTSYTDAELATQLADWARSGLSWVKMKVGRDPGRDAHRVRVARDAIGPGVGLFVDANGAYELAQAAAMAERFADADVAWFEEPRPAWDCKGNSHVRQSAPKGMEIAGGEYIYTEHDAAHLWQSGAVDVLQADVTRCGGFTGFGRIATYARAVGAPLSTHCAPALSCLASCAHGHVRHAEWFHDHVRIERRWLDGMPRLVNGRAVPQPDAPGNGFEFKASQIERFRVA